MNYPMKTGVPSWRDILIVSRTVCAILLLAASLPATAGLTLEQAVTLAGKNDPWLQGSELRQQAVEALSVSEGSLPDPMVDLGFANLPTDTFDFDQEPMTQFRVGLSQVIPRGESLELRRRQLELMGSEYPHRRDERRAQVSVQVAHLWLEAFRARESVRLIEEDRTLFEHLVDVAESSYSAALGRTRQQDLVRAQLELTRLEDRLTVLREQHDIARSKLGAWLYTREGAAFATTGGWREIELAEELPELVVSDPQMSRSGSTFSPQELARYLQNHPAILALDSRIAAGETGIELAEQKYHPQWRLNASYGYRDDDPMGNDRADFFSVGVAFDLPWFTSKRQDPQVQSAAASAEALRTERSLALREMIAAFDAQRARLVRLEERRSLYRDRLLEEMNEQAEASLAAYTHDDGDFSEVVRARIAVLNARIDALDIEVERLKSISQLNYFLVAVGA